MKTCVYCDKLLTPPKRKYCTERCQYWFKQTHILPRKASKTQQLRMNRAARGERKRAVKCCAGYW